MNIYIDESGSINNTFDIKHNFVIALVSPTDDSSLRRSYKRYVSSHLNDLRNNAKYPDRLFLNDKFKEIKGSAMTVEQKKEFIRYFSENSNFSLFYIVLKNHALSDNFCSNCARAFNFSLCNALQLFMNHGLIALDETCNLQLDERNERPDTRNFLENYLNTQFIHHPLDRPFSVQYFDSSNNKLIQIADVFANIYYSHLINATFSDEMLDLKNKGILKCIYQFPYYC